MTTTQKAIARSYNPSGRNCGGGSRAAAAFWLGEAQECRAQGFAHDARRLLRSASHANHRALALPG